MIKSPSGNNISKDKLISILKRVQQNSPQQNSDIKFTEHNWHKPRHFSVDQFTTLKFFADKLAEYIQADITNLCHGDFLVTPLSITEHFSYTLERDFYNNDQNYYLNLGLTTNAHQGFISMTKDSSIAMVKFILAGDEDAENATETISALEESLILDTAETALTALSKTSQGRGGNEIISSNDLVRGNWPLNLDSLEELCRLDFKIEKRSESAEISIIIVSKLLEAALKADDHHPKVSKEAISAAITHKLNEVPVNIVAKISSDLLPMQEITDLQPGDLIMLNRKAQTPIDIQVNGTDIMHAFPATLERQFAMTITNIEND